MGDMGDDFRAWDKEKKVKRASNTVESTRMLLEAGIEYESKNGGAHLIVNTPSGLVDFWPSSGLYIIRSSGQKRRGVRNLFKLWKG